ncbi:uncharacterized protein LOC127585424 [Pristis pectinata]|uniref:uncharacterized protein LOC127585424 n=1 Tax=Pristis pectinata TaxID=685728 RepID=UPI00223CAE41|nr:uncharacterized protein LOC127585424 [Pristis pectinata]
MAWVTATAQKRGMDHSLTTYSSTESTSLLMIGLFPTNEKGLCSHIPTSFLPLAMHSIPFLVCAPALPNRIPSNFSEQRNVPSPSKTSQQPESQEGKQTIIKDLQPLQYTKGETAMNLYPLWMIGILVGMLGVSTELQLPSVLTRDYSEGLQNSPMLPDPMSSSSSFIFQILNPRSARWRVDEELDRLPGELPLCATCQEAEKSPALQDLSQRQALLSETWKQNGKQVQKKSSRQRSPYILKRQLIFNNKWPYILWPFLGIPVPLR